MLARDRLRPAAQAQLILLHENLRGLREQPSWFLIPELGRCFGAGHGKTRRLRFGGPGQVSTREVRLGRTTNLRAQCSRGSVAAMMALTACWLKPL